MVLASKRADSKYFREYTDGFTDVEKVDIPTAFVEVKTVNYKHVYSFTSHIAVYDGCPKQYKYYKEYGLHRIRCFIHL